jgi:hypothetical protein
MGQHSVVDAPNKNEEFVQMEKNTRMRDWFTSAKVYHLGGGDKIQSTFLRNDTARDGLLTHRPPSEQLHLFSFRS